MPVKTRYRRPTKKKTIDPLDLLGVLFDSILGASSKYTMVDRARTKEFVGLTDDMWKKIMMLCHPDKHSNSDLSHEVTRWLITNRPKGGRDGKKTYTTH